MTEVPALPLNDGTVIGPDLRPAGTVSPFGTASGTPVDPAAVIAPQALLAEEREKAAELAAQLTGAVRAYSANRPRSLQRRIGPSEVGSPCTRSLGYKLAGVEPVNAGGGDPWPAFIGTATHAELENVFSAIEGWVTERRVTVDAELDLHGSTDLLRLFGGIAVIDHKVVGPSTLRKARTHGPADYYITQANLYAHGWIAAGIPVEYVAIAYWPRSGQLADLYVWLRRYDQEIADRALKRLESLRAYVAATGPAGVGALPAAEHFCTGCDFYRPGSTDLAVACGGAS